jgi:hypothetical protein
MHVSAAFLYAIITHSPMKIDGGWIVKHQYYLAGRGDRCSLVWWALASHWH